MNVWNYLLAHKEQVDEFCNANNITATQLADKLRSNYRMSSSIADLSNLATSTPIDLDKYPAARTFRLPPAGVYTLQAPESFPDTAFVPNAAGDAVVVTIDPTINDGEFSGFGLRYQKISTKPWGDPPVSKVGQYLKAAGQTGTVTNVVDAVRKTAGTQYRAKLDWRAYNSNSGLQLRGMNNFPQNPDGTYQSWVLDENDLDPETNKPRRVPARLEITRFYPAR